MSEDPNGRLPEGADEPREPFSRPLSMRVRESASQVAQFLEQVEDGTFPKEDQAIREMFRASLNWLESSVNASFRVYMATAREHHKHRAIAMGARELPL